MAFHIFRRQAVYYWRRRAPVVLANRLGRPHVSMSLRTTSRITARRVASQLNLILDDVAMLADGPSPHLTRSQIETMLHAVMEKQLAKLDLVAFAAKNAPGFEVDEARRDDRRALWTYTLLDAHGQGASVRPEDHDRMVAEGLSEADIEAVKRHLAMLRANDMVPTKYHVLRQMNEGVHAAPTAMNMDVAQGTYFRGMRLALAQYERRYGGVRIEDEGLVERLLLARNDLPRAISPAAGPALVRDDDPPKVEATTIPQFIPVAVFLQFAERVAQQNAADGHWDEKTQRQARSIAGLFVKFMVQDQRILDLSLLRQEHVGKFVDFLRFDIYKHYGKSVRDESPDDRAASRKRAFRRKGQARRRWRNAQSASDFLGQIRDHAVARGSRVWKASTSRNCAQRAAARTGGPATSGRSCPSTAPRRSS